MHKILIVEDEMYVRIGIKNCIEWKENGFCEPFEASNGKEAIEILESTDIDIVLTDIKMPEIDGLELIKKIRESNKAIEVIVLSCYNDYEYLREALKMGVCDYLFKPVMLPEDILMAAKKALERLSSKLNVNNKIKLLEKKVEERYPLIKEQLILDLINGKEINQNEFELISNELDIKSDQINIIVIVLKLSNVKEFIAEKYGGDEFLFKFAIMNIIREIFQYKGNSEAVCKSVDEYVIVLFNKNEHSMKKIYSECHEMSSKTIEMLKKYLILTATIGVSKNYYELASIKKAYNDACTCVERGFFIGRGNVIFNEDIYGQKVIGNIEIKELLDELYNSDEVELNNKVNVIYKKIRSSKINDINEIFEISSNVIGILFEKAMLYDNVFEEIYKTEKEVYSKLYKLNDIFDIEMFINSLAVKIENLISSKYRSEITSALKYIEKHYSDEDINLEKVASYVNMNKSYFSRLFKEEIGENFIDFLTRIRMEKAVKLYTTTNYKIYEIAEIVGYPNWRYFCKVYKKHTGNSLSDLRR